MTSISKFSGVWTLGSHAFSLRPFSEGFKDGLPWASNGFLDGRGVTPHQILCMAMTILWFKVQFGIGYRIGPEFTFNEMYRKGCGAGQRIRESVGTARDLFKSIPNSLQNWYSRKKNVFAMIRETRCGFDPVFCLPTKQNASDSYEQSSQGSKYSTLFGTKS